MLKLYSSAIGSSAHRVRIALGLKGLAHEIIPVDLRLCGGEQDTEAYRHINPQGMVPVLVDGDQILTQSVAIMEYLDEAYPDAPRLLPAGALARARVRALALTVACDIQPLGVVRIRHYIADDIRMPQPEQQRWLRHWVEVGFDALETQLASPQTGRYCQGNTPGMADCLLIPQVYKARQLGIDLSRYPIIERIDEHCATLAAFRDAHPDRQPDAKH